MVAVECVTKEFAKRSVNRETKLTAFAQKVCHFSLIICDQRKLDFFK